MSVVSLKWKHLFLFATIIIVPIGSTELWGYISENYPQVLPSTYIAAASFIGVIVAVWFAGRYNRKYSISDEDHGLIAKSHQFLSLYRHSPVPYLTIDRKGMIVMHNLSAMRLFQTKPEDFDGQHFDSKIRHEDDTQLSFILGKLKNQVTINDAEVQLETMRGEMRWVLLSVFASETSRERLVSLVDITHQKKVDLAKSEFVALATHQLRTPITAIRWNTELLAKTMLETKTEKQSLYLVKVERNVMRMLSLINDFLSVSKLETGTFATELQKVKLGEFIESVIDEYAEIIEKKQLRLQRQFEVSDLEVNSDPRLLHIMVSNLVSNAVKYTPDGGEVVVACSIENEKLLLEVADSGIGIPEEEIDQLFTKFFRATNAQKHRAEGTGLGLYIVQQSVEKLGGSIDAHSVYEQGTRFEIRLPI